MPRGAHPNSKTALVVSRRKYAAVSDYFSVADYERGYFAGFLAADGNIRQGGRELSLSLQARDKEILEQMRDHFAGNYPIARGTSHGFPYVRLSITDSELCADLTKVFNITPAKSLTLQPPVGLPEEARDGYVKGYIDGDGSIGLRDNQLRIGVLGTREVTEFVRQEWARVTGLPMPEPRPKHNVWVLEVSDAKARAVFTYYYRLPFGLARKWSKGKYQVCVDWRWRSKKHLRQHELYQFVLDRLGAMSVPEIARERGCTATNIYSVLKSDGFAHFKETA